MVFARVLALELERALIMQDRLGVLAEFRVNGAEVLPDGSLDQRPLSGGAVKSVGDAIDQGADFKVAVRFVIRTGLTQHVILNEVKRSLGVGLLLQSLR